jgi:hypothetical protein
MQINKKVDLDAALKAVFHLQNFSTFMKMHGCVDSDEL